MAVYWILLLTAFHLTLAHDPLEDFCRLHSHRTAIVDRKLYIDGGFVNWSPLTSNPTNETSTWLRVGDFDTPNDGFPQQSKLAKNETVPSVSGGILWPDTANKIIYAYGGEQEGSGPVDTRLWYYDILYNMWNVSNPDGTADVNPAAWGAGTTAPDKALGYYYGGWPTSTSKSNNSAGSALSTMLIYNMLEQKFNMQSGPDQIGRAEGVMLYLPAGDSGLLVYFGGIQMINGTQQPLPMSDIFVYDIANARWYKQTTSGAELPGNRRRFCAGVVWAEDRSSYNIYLFGGAPVGKGIGYGDVWILSLPSFTWIKFFPTAEDEAVAIPHHSLTCDVYANSQMIIMGGHFTNSTDCDVPSIYGQHGLDLGRTHKDGLKWAAFNASLTTYNVPLEITQIIGGNSSGGATATAPNPGWDTGDLGVAFGRRYTPAARPPTRPIPRPSPSRTGDPNTPEPTSGPIIGPAVGGAIAGFFLVLTIGFCIFLTRRTRRHRQATNPHPIARPSPHIELPGALARSYSASSIHRFGPYVALDTSPYTGTPDTPAQGNRVDSCRHTSQTRGVGELDDYKEQVLLVPMHELPSVRSPREMGFSRRSPR